MNDIQFTNIATHYDDLMAGVPYRLWVNYLEDILERLNYHPETILDVACGTGNVSELLAQRGYQVTGIDIAADMIEIAKTKKNGVEYSVQDMTQLDLGGRKFDLAVSLFDSLNYITDSEKLAQGIKKIAGHVVEGGYFIFDVNTIYALSNHFFDQANIGSERYPRYVWKSEYDHATRICRVDMTFEVLDHGETRQFKEAHYQKGYTLEELGQMLSNAGFEVVEIFHAYKLRKPTRRSDRVYFVARKLANG